MDTQTILSIHHNIITQNPRISLSYNDHRSWYLHIKSVQEVDRGWYMCQVNTDPMRSRKGYLQVVVPPSIIDNMTSTDMVVREGSDVSLVCRASGYPEPYVMWRREDGQDFNYNGESVSVVDGETLTITKVSRLHMGAYLCIASNGVPPSISKRIMLMVQFPPMLSIPNQLEGAYIGQDVTLECHTEAYPSSINYWTTDRGDMIISEMEIVGGKYEAFPMDSGYNKFMMLKIRNITKEDFGFYKCIAKNSLGETDGIIKLDAWTYTQVEFNKAQENAITGEAMNYKDFTEYAVKLSSSLMDLGVKRGDTVGVGSEKRVTFVPTALAVVFTGAAYTPYDLKSGRAGLLHKLNLTRPNFEDESLKTAFMFGEWYHNYDTFMTYKFLSAGRKIVYVDTVTPENLMKSIHNCQVNIAMLVPSLVGYLSKAEEVEKYDLSTLKIIYCRSSPLHRKTIEAVKRRYTHYVAPLELETILQLHPGVREAGVVGQPAGDIGELPTAFVVCQRGATVSPQELIDYVSKEISIATGERITCVEFIQHTVVDVETRKVLSKNQTGEICARGPSVMKGYLGIDEKTVFDDDGFFCSGDLGYFDEDDCLYIVGRLKDVFKYKGIQIPPHMKLRGGVQFISELPRNIRASLVMANEEEKPNTVSKSIEDLVHCIYRKCKDESVSGIQIPVELYEERVLNYTNVPRQLLNKILEQKTNFPSFDLFERIIISDNILEMYNKQKSFSFKDIYENIGSQIKVTELSQFCREMALVGYEHVNTLNCGQIVLENPKLAQERLLYLNKIKKLRNVQKPVYYLDERIIDFNQSFKKPWLTDADISKIDGYIFLHIVSKTGFQKGLFCNQPNAEDLIKWISDIVLSTLLPSSVIIMDKSPLHGKTEAEHITRYHSKEDMVKWLQDNNIPCNSNMRKAQLYDLIARCPIKPTKYNLDLLFKSHGHEVIRLPDNYHDLSLAELMWDHVNMNSSLHTNDGNLLNLKSRVLTTIENISHEKWSQFEDTIESTEKRLLDIDEATDEILNTYKIDLKGNSALLIRRNNICVSWVIASEEKTARPDDSVNPHAEHSEYRRLIKAESSSDVGSSVDEKDEKDDKIKKVVKSVGGPVEKAVEKSSDSSSDSSGSGERRKKRAVKFHHY
ncbi:hypothetical protein MSG28_008078 [Choristoneura fumiferana]|uniref:Uncharacterized protein n=1 Tax=Choristoneura fumiferana TaxID=7141 RepID=A0ACC0J9U9_CHOFU|nr:hypothetical protein MSG28_008078 [Choristoneura fumiferana]